MTIVGTLNFLEAAVQTTHDWLADMNHQLHVEDFRKSYQGLRAVLQAIRDRLPVEEAVDLGAQLPMILRGAYYEGWRPSEVPLRIRHAQDFLDMISGNFASDPTIDPVRLFRAAMSVLDLRIPGGEMQDVRNSLPQEILDLLE